MARISNPKQWSQAQIVSFISLVAQNVLLVLIVRASRMRSQTAGYDPSTVVLVTEGAKIVLNASLEWYSAELSVCDSRWLDRKDMLRMTIPAFLYVMQNNLLYVALSNLPVPLYQVTNQGKIMATAFFGYWFMGRKLSCQRIIALLILGFGIALAQLAQAEANTDSATRPASNITSSNANGTSTSGSLVDMGDVRQNQWVGLLSMAISSITSGMAGVYFEWMLKKDNINNKNSDRSSSKEKPSSTHASNKSEYVRNIQLAIPSFFLSAIPVFAKRLRFFTTWHPPADVFGADGTSSGFFDGYDWLVWGVIANQALGGLLVSKVMKYADSNVKVLAISLSVILSSILSSVLLGEAPAGGIRFWAGAALVVSSCVLYSFSPSLSLEPNQDRKRKYGVCISSSTSTRAVSSNCARSGPMRRCWMIVAIFLVMNFVTLMRLTQQTEQESSWDIPAQGEEHGQHLAHISQNSSGLEDDDELFPACTPTEYYRNRPDGTSEALFHKIETAQEIVNFIVTELHKFGAPVALLFGTALHEYRNGTGNCVLPYVKEDDFDIGVFEPHFHYVVSLTGQIEKKFGWQVITEAPGYPTMHNNFLYMKPKGQRPKGGFQVDVYSLKVDNPSNGIISFYWDKVRMAMNSTFPLVKHKPVLTTSNKTMVKGDNTPFFYMPFNPTCYFTNLYGETFMTPRKIKPREVHKATWNKGGWQALYGRPLCHQELSEKEMTELQRQRSFVNITHNKMLSTV